MHLSTQQCCSSNTLLIGSDSALHVQREAALGIRKTLLPTKLPAAPRWRLPPTSEAKGFSGERKSRTWFMERGSLETLVLC